MSKDKFLEVHGTSLFQFETEEIQTSKFEQIYFSGQCLARSAAELLLLKTPESEEQIIKDFDDEEGYYNVLLNDHLIYRYELLKILGKGSFAQVVSCFDHKEKR